tara:strand:- start:1233 stop:1442 length:210 start_codon:yes stop_codon:yes gene_type:complete
MQKKFNALQNKKTKATSSRNFDYLERKRLEMKRRVGILKYKRSCLERELISIQGALRSLEDQISKDQGF